MIRNCKNLMKLFIVAVISMVTCSMNAAEVLANTQIMAKDFAVGATHNDETAVGGVYATHPNAYHALVKTPIPAEGNEWEIFIRTRKGPVCAKGIVNGNQKELKWTWNTSADWKWVSLGKHKRDVMSDGVLFIRGSASNVSHMDAIMFVNDDKFNPIKSAPVAEKTTQNTQSTQKSDMVDKVLAAKDFAAGQIKIDGSAYTGNYVTNSNEYHPIVAMDLPKDGDAWTIFIHTRRGPVCLKGKNGNTQKELKWTWNKSPEWKWISMGRFTRDQMPNGIVLISGSKAAIGEIDAVMFSSNGNTYPQPLNAVPKTETDPKDAKDAAVEIDFNQKVKDIPPMSYGINMFQGFSPTYMGNKDYQTGMDYLNPGLMRLHSANQMHSKSNAYMLDDEKKTWNKEHVKKVLTSFEFGDTPVLFTICTFPNWMKKTQHGQLDKSEFDNYAKLCADLVQYVQKDLGIKIKYWEITNEKDDAYWVKTKDPKIEDLAELYIKCAKAMKAVDPTILTGGPASARSDRMKEQEKFAKLVLPYLDFFSFHMYASGSAKDPNSKILYQRIKSFEKMSKSIYNMINRISPDRKIELFLNEYNISWTWDVRDVRMTNHVGAVFHALSMLALINANIDGGAAWNECDGIYGTMDSNCIYRPAAHLFHLLNAYGHGAQYKSSSSTDDVVTLVVKDKNDKKMVLVINRGEVARNVKFSEVLDGSYTVYDISSLGFSNKKVENISNVLLEPVSLKILVEGR